MATSRSSEIPLPLPARFAHIKDDLVRGKVVAARGTTTEQVVAAPCGSAAVAGLHTLLALWVWARRMFVLARRAIVAEGAVRGGWGRLSSVSILACIDAIACSCYPPDPLPALCLRHRLPTVSVVRLRDLGLPVRVLPSPLA